MNLIDCVPSDPQDHLWDVVVIGTGAGGATAGFNLARLGRSVLFLERGKLLDSTSPVTWIECAGTVDVGSPSPGVLPKNYPSVSSVIPIGCGVGGSTAVFGMVMDRFRPVDLTPRCFSPAPSNTSLPDEWPIQYDELEPHYREAESLFRVRGTDDPVMPTGGLLVAPRPPSEVETIIQDTLTQCGLHPYRMHYACESILGCDGCFHQVCPHACRNDAGRICVGPALEQHGARILSECRVVKLEANGRTVRGATCVWNGRYMTIRARVFVLALHALFTPALLLRSANSSFPHGLGNTSDMVGRNLMLHVSDSLLLRFDRFRGPLNGRLHHGQSLNDFYIRDGIKLGNIHAHAQDFARTPDEGTSLDSTGTAIFHTIVEDFPYLENRVTPKPGTGDDVCWEYKYPNELRVRSRILVSEFAQALASKCEVEPLSSPGSLNLNRGHACGTCRFGDNPRTSVLDRDNRVHDLDNVYVVDGSFLPSSSGINPSLTIVANSLRVSALIARRY